jgi:SWI/SNF-related matrix-associated actin-dependent regulator 1 of chromatin subfamily A
MFQKKKVKCIRIDGQTPVPVRQTLVTDFQNKDDIKAAVVCVRICMLYIY